jgi:hypothetical protein
MLKIRNLIVFTMAFALVVASASADVYMKQRVSQPEAKDKKDVEQIHETWITPTKVRSNAGDQSSIFDAEKNLLVAIDHAKKKYVEIPLDFSGAASAEEQQDLSNLPGFMKKMMKMEIKVEPANEQKQIGQWLCRKYLQTMKMTAGSTESEIWASEDIHINTELYTKFSAALMASLPGFYKMLKDIMNECEKIKGIVVFERTTSKMMGKHYETTEELLEVKDVDAAADLFAVPAGYKKEKFKEK